MILLKNFSPGINQQLLTQNIFESGFKHHKPQTTTTNVAVVISFFDLRILITSLVS
jgi:hypothetical protein